MMRRVLSMFLFSRMRKTVLFVLTLSGQRNDCVWKLCARERGRHTHIYSGVLKYNANWRNITSNYCCKLFPELNHILCLTVSINHYMHLTMVVFAAWLLYYSECSGKWKTVFYPSGLSALATNIRREYHYVKKSKTWADARNYCRKTFTDLATVVNRNDDNRLLSVLQGRGKHAWIGLYDDLTRWTWSLRNAAFSNEFSMWKSNEPNNIRSKESCTVMATNGLWLDTLCSGRRPSVCFNGKKRCLLSSVTSCFIRISTQRKENIL